MLLQRAPGTRNNVVVLYELFYALLSSSGVLQHNRC